MDRKSETESDEMEEEQENYDRICRYCLSGKNADDLISPCDCQGTSKYVHSDCLAQWIKTKHSSSLRINIMQQNTVERELQCTECRGTYKIRIGPVSWNTFFYRLVFDTSNQRLLQKMGLQIAWILFQSTTLSLVSRAFIKSFHQLNGIQTVQSIMHWIVYKVKLFFYHLVHPIIWLFYVLHRIKNCVITIFGHIINPYHVVRCVLEYFKKIMLIIRILFLFILIVQHTASITMNSTKLYHVFKRHKLNLVKLQILQKEEQNNV